MKVTFPHMGNLYIPMKTILLQLGVDVLVPPPSSKNTLTLGVKYGPEFACLPLKLNIGNFIEAYEQGADTILMAGGCGPCRFGYYAQVQHAILRDIGCDMQLIVLEPPERGFSELLMKIKLIAGSRSWWQIVKAIGSGYKKAKAVDKIEMTAFRIRPREIIPGSTDLAYRQALELIDSANDNIALDVALDKATKLMMEVALSDNQPILRIGLVGEIYTLLEPFSNQNIERHIGRLGVQIDRSIYLSEWVNDHIFLGLAKGIRSKKAIRDSAHPYLRHFVGGHGLETVGSTVNYAKLGYDGVIQVYPFTCMPEIVAESVMPQVSNDFGIPTLALVMDEHTGEAGMITRLEAFIDLLERRKLDKEAMLS